MAVTYNQGNQIVKMTADSDTFTATVYVESILISSTAGGEFIIADAAEEELFRLTTAAGELTRQIFINRYVKGIFATNIANGTVHIFLGKK